MRAKPGLTKLLQRTLLLLPVALMLTGCETFDKYNPFAEKETPLPGERRPLFPEGVPGVDFGAPPPQPSNSNIPIPSSIGEGESPQSQQTEQSATQTASAPPQTQRSGATGSQDGSDDAWAGTR